MEILRRAEDFIPNWSYDGHVAFSFKTPGRLTQFSEFVTDIDNAHLVFSTSFYEVEGLKGKGVSSVENHSLRKEGAEFVCKGVFLPSSLRIKTSIDFEVTEYTPDEKVQIESRHFQVIGHDLLLKMKLLWDFDHAENEASFGLNLRSRIPAFGKLFLPSKRKIDEEMGIIGRRIFKGFNNNSGSR